MSTTAELLTEVVRRGINDALAGMTMRSGHHIRTEVDPLRRVVVLRCVDPACSVPARSMDEAALLTEPGNVVEATLQAEATKWRDDHVAAWAAEARRRAWELYE